jgi:hypothetical protein
LDEVKGSVTVSSISNNPSQVNFSPVVSSLVNNAHSGTYKPFNRRQKRTFQRLTSWCLYLISSGYQLFRVDLTTAPGGDSGALTPHFKKLRRRVEKKFPGYRVHFFKIQTSEGNGVLHMIWAIKSDHAVWIPQEWIKSQWLEIHGASIVYIRRMKIDKSDIRRVGRYLSLQYLSRQSAIVRVSWSWWRDGLAIGQAWDFFKRVCFSFSPVRSMVGLNLTPYQISYREMIRGWEQILSQGWWLIGGMAFFKSGRSIDVGINYE